MLTQLSINNYALINQLSIDFDNGLSIITGETGAGKSILLGALGLSCIFTFIAALSGIDRGGTTIMSVMALPLVLPVILLLIKITAVSMALMVDTSVGGDILILAAIDLMICGLMLLLFPIIWRS